MNSNRILLVTPYSLDDYGGVQNQVILAKKHLVKRGYDVRIFANGSTDYNNNDPVVIPFNGSKARVSLICNKIELSKALDWCDIIHIHGPFIPLIFWRINTKKKIVTTHHANISKYISHLLKIIYKIFTKDLLIINTCVSKQSYFQAESLRKKPTIIPNYIAIQQFQKFNSNGFRLSFIGRNERRKGLNIFIKAIDSYLLNHFRPTVISNKKTNQIYVDSYINLNNTQKFEILKESSVLVVPNTGGESFGIIILEGITNGCLVISSDLEAFINVLKTSGIYFKNRSHKDLNITIKEVLSLDMEKLWLKQNAHIGMYDIEKILDLIIELYK